jgi:hypothetical protein
MKGSPGSARDRLFGTQRVVEYQEEARNGGLGSHEALTYDHSSTVGTWAKSELSPGQALREPARCLKSWTRVWSRRSTPGWKASRSQIRKESGTLLGSSVFALDSHGLS